MCYALIFSGGVELYAQHRFLRFRQNRRPGVGRWNLVPAPGDLPEIERERKKTRMKRLRNALSLTLALALVLSLTLTCASAVELTYDNAQSFIDVQVNADADAEVFIDEADAVDYYNPYWGQTSSNTGYFTFERDTTITVTYLPGVDQTGNELGEPFVRIFLFPYRQQADGSYVAALEENEYGSAMPYVLHVDGTFKPVENGRNIPGNYSMYDGGTMRGLNPGESVTFTLPFDELGDDLLYEVQAILSFNWHEDEMSGMLRSNNSWKYVRAILDGQAGAAGAFTDVPADAWYAPYVNAAVEAGLMNGTGNGQFSPAKTLSLAEVITLAARFHAENSGSTVPASAAGEAWYQGAYDYCVDNGLFTAAEVPSSALTDNATRFQMVDLLDRAVPESDKAPIHTDVTVPDVAEDAPYADVVYRWYQAGITQGDQNGNFNGNSLITRGETAAIFCRLAGLTERV